MNESIVILSSYQFTAVALTQKLLNGFHDSLVPLVVCAGWARPKKKVIIKVSHSVVAKGTVCVWGGGEGRGLQRPSGITGISAISLI